MKQGIPETGCLAVKLELIINTGPLDPDGRDVFSKLHMLW